MIEVRDISLPSGEVWTIPTDGAARLMGRAWERNPRSMTKRLKQMEKTEAENIAKELADFCRAEVGRDPRRAFVVGERVEAAMYTAARDLLPPKATAAVIEQGEAPFVLAVDGQQVYVLKLNDPSDANANANEDIVSIRSMSIAPDSPHVDLKTKLLGERIRDEPVTRSDAWSFTLPDGTPITIEVRVNPAGRLDPRAAVAFKLAEAFGMKVPAGEPAVKRVVARAA